MTDKFIDDWQEPEIRTPAGGFVNPAFIPPASPPPAGLTFENFVPGEPAPMIPVQPSFQPSVQPQFAQPQFAQPQFAQPSAQPQFAQPSAQPQFAQPSNPLQAYYRPLGMYTLLPSGGRWTPGLTTNEDREIAVYPMTTADEILSKNPDALMTGEATAAMLHSCIKGLTDAWSLPAVDVDHLIIAIRIVSFGNTMPMSCKCPACEKEWELEIDLTDSLLNASMPMNDSYDIRIGDLHIAMQPPTYRDQVILQRATFTATKRLQNSIRGKEDDQEATKTEWAAFNSALQDAGYQHTAACIASITTPTGSTSDRDHIADFVKNSSRQYMAEIVDAIQKMTEAGIPKKIKLACADEACNHQWETELQLDPSHFFG